ncbi:Hypothetical protein, putative [Bodo saltans]|uniref:Uncharacterized protein n=1 Tax=Bodo saltans TaxID=75058 RepID=A0A0S4ITI8_BODSA|nr:Hypothetical protein, putative [Bodo saltans]|eukprot:CUF78568.1 Hypothetical protein, putative [Bodo saltans]
MFQVMYSHRFATFTALVEAFFIRFAVFCVELIRALFFSPPLEKEASGAVTRHKEEDQMTPPPMLTVGSSPYYAIELLRSRHSKCLAFFWFVLLFAAAGADCSRSPGDSERI